MTNIPTPRTFAAIEEYRKYGGSPRNEPVFSSDMFELEEELTIVTEQRDRLAEALEECKEDSIELLGERDWWQNEPRCGHKKRYEETSENITRADKILAIVKGISNE
jgi:hypothetical protein